MKGPLEKYKQNDTRVTIALNKRGSPFTVFNLLTTHAPISVQSSNLVVF